MTSIAFRRAANAEQTDEVIVALITVTHDDLDGPQRFSSDNSLRLADDPLRYGTRSRGDDYDYLPVELVLPSDSDDTEAAIQLTMDNISRSLSLILRSFETPALVTVELVLASAPDVVEGTWPEFDLTRSTIAAEQVSVDLTMDSDANEPYPSGLITPASFPGLF